jgi:lipopolysaccharide transport system ATP-binding protein
LRGVSLAVAPGEALGIVGGNGSGKSSLLRVLAGVLKPTRGSVRVEAPVGAVIELPLGMDRDLSGLEFIDVTGVLHGMTRRQVRFCRDEIVGFSGLESAALDEPLRTYSAGMVIRLELAVTLQLAPAVVVLDEVLAAADPSFQERCMDRVAEMLRGGSALVIATHDHELVAQRCDRVAVLRQGELVHDGDVGNGLLLV